MTAENEANGKLPEEEKARWVERTGWAPRFGTGSIDESAKEESLLDQTTWVEENLEDKFFGGTVLQRCSPFSAV